MDFEVVFKGDWKGTNLQKEDCIFSDDHGNW